MTLAKKTHLDSTGWQFGSKLTTDHVWDTFLILLLLEDHLQHHSQLQVPQTGSQNNQFNDVMDNRNNQIVPNGQFEMPHYCHKCLCVFQMDDGTYCE
jgi:hypothetical protein